MKKSTITNPNKIITEMDSSSSAGFYNIPFRPGMRLWKKKEILPFTEKLNGYDNAELYVDALDGNIETKNAKEIEKKSEKISRYYEKHPTQNDDDGDILNDYSGTPKKIKEATENTGGEYTPPLSFGNADWDEHVLAPFTDHSGHHHNTKVIKKEVKGKINFKHGGYVEKDHPNKGKHSRIITPKEKKDVVNEDLAVWFGTKKKPKGSKQPKGPWVNICKKVDGKHPPCGRPEASDKAYPKCRAAGVAGKMSDSQKKSACQQKRKAEKSNPKSGTGNKPKMVSYKPKKKKTQNESIFMKLIKKNLNEGLF